MSDVLDIRGRAEAQLVIFLNLLRLHLLPYEDRGLAQVEGEDQLEDDEHSEADTERPRVALEQLDEHRHEREVPVCTRRAEVVAAVLQRVVGEAFDDVAHAARRRREQPRGGAGRIRAKVLIRRVAEGGVEVVERRVQPGFEARGLRHVGHRWDEAAPRGMLTRGILAAAGARLDWVVDDHEVQVGVAAARLVRLTHEALGHGHGALEHVGERAVDLFPRVSEEGVERVCGDGTKRVDPVTDQKGRQHLDHAEHEQAVEAEAQREHLPRTERVALDDHEDEQHHADRAAHDNRVEAHVGLVHVTLGEEPIGARDEGGGDHADHDEQPECDLAARRPDWAHTAAHDRDDDEEDHHVDEGDQPRLPVDRVEPAPKVVEHGARVRLGIRRGRRSAVVAPADWLSGALRIAARAYQMGVRRWARSLELEARLRWRVARVEATPAARLQVGVWRAPEWVAATQVAPVAVVQDGCKACGALRPRERDLAARAHVATALAKAPQHAASGGVVGQIEAQILHRRERDRRDVRLEAVAHDVVTHDPSLPVRCAASLR
mmetsp:Transcript_33200/g.87261  ORF Transcript_33200/g.87261 Transcript_33200/m.87261 type:complete len:548 (-) Transcript_33200:1124-2767(-)